MARTEVAAAAEVRTRMIKGASFMVKVGMMWALMRCVAVRSERWNGYLALGEGGVWVKRGERIEGSEG